MSPLSPDAGPGSESLRVLVVDDSTLVQRFAVLMLASRGHDVTSAASGADALREVGQRSFDVVLMDVQMPEMDGNTTTARMRETGGLDHLPIIALTAGSEDSDWPLCQASGMNDYLAKPFRQPELVTMVERWGWASRTAAGDARSQAGESA